MKKLIGILLLAIGSHAALLVSPAILFVSPAILFVSPTAMASDGGVRLDPAPINQTDVISLQSGARTFANYCLNCHSASLMRWNRLMELGLTESQIKDNLMFSGDKVGELMRVAMSRNDARQWFGAAPPDLSVIARARGADWLYTYLHGFYRDPARPTGWNNTVYENVAMPNPLWQLQGERVRVEQAVKGDDAKGRRGWPRRRDQGDKVRNGETGQPHAGAVRRDRARSGELSRLPGRAGSHQPQADRHCCAAVFARPVAVGLSPEKRILEGCALTRKLAVVAGSGEGPVPLTQH